MIRQNRALALLVALGAIISVSWYGGYQGVQVSPLLANSAQIPQFPEQLGTLEGSTKSSARTTTTEENLLCRVGKSPWSDLTPGQFQALVEEFAGIYRRRPRGGNDGGGGFFHYFALFTIIRQVKPTAIVESGAWKGMGTWFLRQAAGNDVKIVVVSPQQPGLYVDPNGLYLTGEKFVDFSKTTVEQWEQWVPDIKQTLLFMDDHQAELRRLLEARALGFVHMAYDDNYPPGTGDNFSLKKACSGMKLWHYLGETVALWQDDFDKVRRALSDQEFQQYYQSFHNAVDVYAEFPPTWKGPSRFPSLQNDTKLAAISEPSLFARAQLEAWGLGDEDIDGWKLEAEKYTFIVYARIKQS